MAKEVSTQDIYDLLQDFMQMVSDRFDRLEVRMDRLEKRMDRLEERVSSLEKNSREHTTATQELTERVGKIEFALSGVDEDITYLYKLIENLKKDLKKGRLSEEDTRSRLEEVEAIARQLSKKYGLNRS